MGCTEMKYILEYKPIEPGNNGSFQMTFKENTNGNETLMWVISPTGRKELETKMSARERWNALIEAGWYRVSKGLEQGELDS